MSMSSQIGFRVMKYFGTFLLIATTVGCDGGDGKAPANPDPAGGGGTASILLMNHNYTGETGSSVYLDLTMPVDGVLDVAAPRANVSIYDPSLTLLQGDSGVNGTYTQFNLSAGSYKVKLTFWSSLEKSATVYSPSILIPTSLPALQNSTYTTALVRSDYFILRMPSDGNVEFTGPGTGVSIYDTEMNFLRGSVENSGPIQLNAGDYVVRFVFWSANTKSMTVYSPALE